MSSAEVQLQRQGEGAGVVSQPEAGVHRQPSITTWVSWNRSACATAQLASGQPAPATEMTPPSRVGVPASRRTASVMAGVRSATGATAAAGLKLQEIWPGWSDSSAGARLSAIPAHCW